MKKIGTIYVGKHGEKRGNCLLQGISPFLRMFFQYLLVFFFACQMTGVSHNSVNLCAKMDFFKIML